MKWYMPSWNGDFRLEPHTKEGGEGGLREPGKEPESICKLVLFKPTPGEIETISKFLETAYEKKWTDVTHVSDADESTIVLNAPMADAGDVLVKLLKPVDRTITAVSFRDGKVEVSETSGAKALVEKGEEKKAKAAASVSRPTPSCPDCYVGAIAPATEVLLSFLSLEQHESWKKTRTIVVHGGRTGHRYLLAHRHTKIAERLTRVCYDMDDRCVVHFHQHECPPEEEILAAKLILEHREPWLRNEATMLGVTDREVRSVFKNPFGNFTDGIPDATFTKQIGAFIQGHHMTKKLLG